MNLKINLSDPHALRIIWKIMLLNPAMICPIWVNQKEGKREMFLPSLSRSLIGQTDKENPKLASPEAKVYKVCLSIFLVFAGFRKAVNACAVSMRV